MKVFINPGHAPDGNPDPGATNARTGLRECDVALEVASSLAYYLNLVNIETKVVQSDSLSEVVLASNEWDANLFISIHCNAYNETARGTETWYYHCSDLGAELANCVQKQIIDSINTVNRGIKGAKPGVNGLYVLTHTVAPAILVELAFIDNDDDAAILANRIDDFAKAIARGITDYSFGV